jgi:hypothetical protein
MMEVLIEVWCHIPPIELQTLVESMPWGIAAVLAARGGLLKLHYEEITPPFPGC